MKDPKRFLIYYAEEGWYLTETTVTAHQSNDMFVTGMTNEGNEKTPDFYGSEVLEAMNKFLAWYKS